MTDWKTVNGSQVEKPLEFDTMSSAQVVYQRRNVKEVEQKNTDGTTVNLWEYEERTLTPAEYQGIRDTELSQKLAQARADIDFLSAMTGTDL